MIRPAIKIKGICGIYGVIHRDSGRVYVGSSNDIGTRRRRHKSCAFVENKPGKFYNALRKYGFEAFDFEILETCDQSQLHVRERFWIQFLDSVNNGFNLAAHPERSRFGVKASPETNAKVSSALRGKKRKPFTAEHIENLRIAGRERYVPRHGRACPEHLKEKYRLLYTGKKHSPEAIQKISEAGKGRIVSQETRAKISLAHRGKIISNYHAARISESNSKPVLQIDPDTEEIINEFSSSRDAARYFGCDPSSISGAIRGKTKTCQSFIWKLKSEV